MLLGRRKADMPKQPERAISVEMLGLPFLEAETHKARFDLPADGCCEVKLVELEQFCRSLRLAKAIDDQRITLWSGHLVAEVELARPGRDEGNDAR